MKIMTEILGEVNYEPSDVIVFAEGLYGFADMKNFIMINIAETELPFQWLQSIDDEHLSFVMTTPFAFHEGYDFEIPDKIIAHLGIESTDDLAVFSLVVLKDEVDESTINLKAPILINIRQKKAVQLILNEDFPYKYKLFKRQEA